MKKIIAILIVALSLVGCSKQEKYNPAIKVGDKIVIESWGALGSVYTVESISKDRKVIKLNGNYCLVSDINRYYIVEESKVETLN